MVYFKIINGRKVFSTCATIQTDDGVWVSNPSEEQIAAAGWKVYVPPIVPPQPELKPDYEAVVEAVKKFLSTDTSELSDEDALAVAALYPTWADRIDTEVAVGERLWYDGKLYRVIQAHTVSNLWTPDHTPALYAEVSIEEWPEIPEVIPAESPWMKGDKGTWKGQHYICVMDNTVWNPDVYPAAWEAQE